MRRSHALQHLRVILDNANSLEVMAFAFERSIKFLDDEKLVHGARIISGISVSIRTKLVRDKKEILEHLTKRSVKHGKGTKERDD